MIDIEKFICSLLADHPEGVTVRSDIHKALKDQGLEYKDGKIVSIEDERVWLTKFIQEEIDCLRFDIRDCDDRIKLKNLQRSLAWLEKQSKESKVEQAMREVEKKAEAFTQAHKGETSEEILAQMRGEENLAWSEEDLDRIRTALFGTYAVDVATRLLNKIKSCGCEADCTAKQEWSEEDENGFGDALWAIQQARTIAKDENDMGNLWYAEKWINAIKERVQSQPKQEWSEEDYNEIETIACHLDNIDNEGMAEVLRNIRDKYYSQTTWKPSKEQMEAMQVFLEHGCAAPDREASLAEKVLELLYNDLKRLREE